MTHFQLGMAILGAVILLLAFCVGICIAEQCRLSFAAWAERRAITRRDADQAAEQSKREAEARKWGMVPFYPRKDRHIDASAIDPAHRTGQFSIPRTMRDVKGVHRPLRLPDVRRSAP